MTLANKLTLSRLAVLPLIALVSATGTAWGWWIALILGIAAAVTDLLDGYIARSTNTVTEFGKAMDPIADKALFFTLALPLSLAGDLSWLLIWLFLIREFVVSGLRIAAAGHRGIVIAAGWLGKIKTALQDVGILVMFLGKAATWSAVLTVGSVLVWAAALFTLISMIQYLVAYREVIQ